MAELNWRNAITDERESEEEEEYRMSPFIFL